MTSPAPARGVLITGGTGAVGRALVEGFRQEGYAVFFTWHRDEAGAHALAAATGSGCCRADLTVADQVRLAVDRAEEELGGIEVLVNNAGLTQVLPLTMMEEEDWDLVLGANLKSTFLVTRETVRRMIPRQRGVIVNMGSLAGRRLLAVPAHYAAAKAGVAGFGLALARELSRYNIRVNTLEPGLLEGGVGELVPEREREEYRRFCSLGRLGTPAEVARAALFLASPAASFVNGQSLQVDGGI